MFESSKCFYKQLYIKRSIILEKQGSTDIGLQLLSFVLLAALNIGVTFAIFKLSGNILFSKDKLNRYCKGSQSPPKQLLVTLKLISSCPEHLFVFIEKKSSFNSLTIIAAVGRVELDFGT